MDPKLVIGFIFSHYVLILGMTLALFFTVSMVLLIRSIGQKSGEIIPIDVDAIEGVMKRVLSAQPISIASTPVRPAPAPRREEESSFSIGSDGDGVSSEVLAEHNATIESLKQEIDSLKAAATQADDGGPADSSPYMSEIADLNEKVEELQARLAEYEIIEDDIADLSMFKEKNRTLEAEIMDLRTKLGEAAAEVAAAPAPASEEPARSLTPSLDSGIKFEKIERFELDLNNEAMKAFADAVDGTSAAIEAVKTLPAQDVAPVATPVATPVAVKVTTADLGTQSDIDALFKAHVGGAPASQTLSQPTDTPVASVDSQSDIDALMKAHTVPAAVTAPVPALALGSEPVVAKHIPYEAGLDDLLMGGALLSPEEMFDEVPREPLPVTQVTLVASDESEDPLAGVTDAEKMLSEVETITDASTASDDDALEEVLDTDKLLAEVDSLKAGIKSA